MRKALSIMLLLCVLLCALSATATAQSYDPVVKIGLYYDSSALVAANLQNVTGMDVGYSCGYYDGDRLFVPCYEIADITQITVLKNSMLWRTGKTYSDTETASYDEVIGAYCLQIDDLFDHDTAVSIRDTLQEDYDLNAYLCYVRNGFRVRIGTYLTQNEAFADAESLMALTGYPLVGRSPSGTCYTVVATGACDILFQFDMLGDAHLGILPNSEQTWFKGYKYYGGFEYFRPDGNKINVVNVVGITDYVKGVIPYEMNPSWPIEALKAQALCAKSYTMNNIGKHKSKGFDLCNKTDCQVYYGTNSSNEYSDSAVDAVAGKFVMYDGKICNTFYHASSGGYTEDVENIWGSKIPYLRAVEDKYLTVLRPFSYTLDLEDISWILKNKNLFSQNVTDLYVSKYSAVGNVIGLTVVLEDGSTKTFSGDRARTALNSPTLGVSIGSHRYTINGGFSEESVYVNGVRSELSGLYVVSADGTPQPVTAGEGMVTITGDGLKELSITPPDKAAVEEGVYVISGTGSGHNIGMSQWGAHAMALEGFTCEEIITFYFTGATVDYYEPN